MSKRRTERLLSIVVLLLSSRRYLTAEEIRAAVRGYPDEHEAFKRMFERDKEELRELGIPLETGVNNALDEEPGYRIKKQDYELPEIRLEADEAAVLGIASRVWQSAALAGAAAGALLKLKAARTARLRPGRRQAEPGHRAPAEHPGARVRPALGGRQGPPPGDVRPHRQRPLHRDQAGARALGRGQQEGPLVRGRPRPHAERRRGSSGSAASRAR